MTEFEQYALHGWKLCIIDRGSKAPRYVDWNTPEKIAAATDAAEGADGMGLCHADSGTCAIDIDNMTQAKAWLAERDVDLDSLLTARDAVRIESGKPGRSKLLYRMKRPLRTIQPKGVGIEFRCATVEGLSMQDVLPPTLHPETRKPYRWVYGEELLGDWRKLPPVPSGILNAWRKQIAEMGDRPIVQGGGSNQALIALDRLEKLIFKNRDPNCEYLDWLKVGMQLHHEGNGSQEAFDIWKRWSMGATRRFSDSPQKASYPGDDVLITHWHSFESREGKAVATGGSLVAEEVAEPDEFPFVEGMEGATVLPIPKAQHLCTDQANAERLHKRYGQKLIAVSGTFYAYDGKRWKADDRLPQRFACELSQMVKAEVAEMETRVAKARRAISDADMQVHLDHPRLNPLDKTKEGREYAQMVEALEALKKWSKKCEMKTTQDAALGLLKKLLTVEASQLDSDPWLLNSVNGIIDMRTGELHEHRASDFITKLAPVRFDPTAKAGRFEAFLVEIFAGDKALIEFMQRWFGYCATGSVREQCIVIHWGGGSNGKSTLIGILTFILGDYATPLPTGMLTAKNSDNRHPAEIAMLRGARFVTASESEDGAKIREAFVKEMSGGDALKARHMYGELFTFQPTHKLQMLTNHKPQVRGSDHGIWRRLRLVPYTVVFGTAEEVSAGKAAHLKDSTLPEALERQKAGILAWLVEGARRWHVEGLQPPEFVLAASREYREEQDRLGEFIRDRCRLNPRAPQPLPDLYRAYKHWCQEAGIEYALTRQRFVDELEQRVPGFQRPKKSNGVYRVTGIELMTEEVDLTA